MLLIEDFNPTEDRLAMSINTNSDLHSVEDMHMHAYHCLQGRTVYVHELRWYFGALIVSLSPFCD